MKSKKLRTLDDICGKPPGSFKKWLAETKARERAEEQQKRERIRAASKARRNRKP